MIGLRDGAAAPHNSGLSGTLRGAADSTLPPVGALDSAITFRWACLMILATGCTDRAPRDTGPVVTVADSLVLAEPDSLETFLPLRTHALTRQGHLFLETGTAIVHFDPAGALVRVLGGPGRGPGEFQRISSLGLLPGDSLLAAVDARRARIVVFGVNDGALRREVVLQTPFYPTQQWVARGDTLILPGKLRRTPFTTWVTTTDSLAHWGTAPPIHERSLNAYSQGGEPSLAPHDDGWVALFPADAALHVLDGDGATKQRMELPVRRRRGVPTDVAEQVAAIAETDSFRFAASLVLAIRRLRTGQYLVIHLDADTEVTTVNDPNSGGTGISYHNIRHWVSLVSPDLRRACVDGLVPLEVDNILSPFFRDDVLHFVARRLDDSGTLRSVLYSFRVTETGCTWLPTDLRDP